MFPNGVVSICVENYKCGCGGTFGKLSITNKRTAMRFSILNFHEPLYFDIFLLKISTSSIYFLGSTFSLAHFLIFFHFFFFVTFDV